MLLLEQWQLPPSSSPHKGHPQMQAGKHTRICLSLWYQLLPHKCHHSYRAARSTSAASTHTSAKCLDTIPRLCMGWVYIRVLRCSLHWHLKKKSLHLSTTCFVTALTIFTFKRCLHAVNWAFQTCFGKHKLKCVNAAKTICQHVGKLPRRRSHTLLQLVLSKASFQALVCRVTVLLDGSYAYKQSPCVQFCSLCLQLF